MKDKRPLWISLMTVVIISVIALAGTIAAGWSPKLGLDLDGGLQVVYKTAHQISTDQLNTTVNILNNRVDALGASGATVASQSNNEIAVSIPGAKNVNQILATLGNTAQLFFRPVLCNALPFYRGQGKSSIDRRPAPMFGVIGADRGQHRHHSGQCQQQRQSGQYSARSCVHHL